MIFSCISGIAFVAMHIRGFNNEFTTIPGIYEEITDITLNVGQVVLIGSTDYFLLAKLSFEKCETEIALTIITAANIDLPPYVTLMDPTQYICQMYLNDCQLEIEFLIMEGTNFMTNQYVNGFMPNEWIAINANFMPVIKVMSYAESYREPTIFSLEFLFLNVITNGAINPMGAMCLASYYILDSFRTFHHFIFFNNNQLEIPECYNSTLDILDFEIMKGFNRFLILLNLLQNILKQNLAYFADSLHYEYPSDNCPYPNVFYDGSDIMWFFHQINIGDERIEALNDYFLDDIKKLLESWFSGSITEQEKYTLDNRYGLNTKILGPIGQGKIIPSLYKTDSIIKATNFLEELSLEMLNLTEPVYRYFKYYNINSIDSFVSAPMIDLLDLKFQGSNVVRLEFCNELYKKLFKKFEIDTCNFTLSPLFDNVRSSKEELFVHENLLFVHENLLFLEEDPLLKDFFFNLGEEFAEINPAPKENSECIKPDEMSYIDIFSRFFEINTLDIDNLMLEILDLKTRPYNVLRKHNITTIGMLMRYSKVRLLELVGIGSVRILDIEKTLHEHFDVELNK
uniref:Alpha subunit of RNA polymerase n=1 Tax=Karlodinium veneficum TaxID=407301 RepID=G1E757_KARVE|nr:alpha subunit of RNA polymerase [Karlodinium veneficum]